MLANRSMEGEELDNFDIEPNTLYEVLTGLQLINSWLGNTSLTLKEVVKIVEQFPAEKLKIVDLGCGGGDNLRTIEAWCKLHNTDIELVGIDGNHNVVNYAREQNVIGSKITYYQADILNPEFEIPSCDVLISSHFLYHFTDDGLSDFLIKSAPGISHVILFTDLQRSPIPYFLFKVFSTFLPLNGMVRRDGLTAIARAFKRKELVSIVKKAGFLQYSIRWKWAFRYLVKIEM